MTLTPGWYVVIIVVVTCVLLLSLGLYHIPEDDQYEAKQDEEQDTDRVNAGRHRRSRR